MSEEKSKLLDEFAMVIIQGMIASESHQEGLCLNKLSKEEYPEWYERNAGRAYDWAEALMKEREKRQGK